MRTCGTRGVHARCRSCTRQHSGQRHVSSRAVNQVSSDALVDVCKGTQRGQSTSAQDKERILQLVEELAASQVDRKQTGQALSATWKLIWTTEKETLFILQQAKRFGTEAGDVYQVIDLDERFLQNVITFPPEGGFFVDSDISVESEQRVQFKFSGATFKVNGRTFGVPPFGKGWFDTVYMDDKIRIAKDIRGDTLVVANDGAPKRFA